MSREPRAAASAASAARFALRAVLAELGRGALDLVLLLPRLCASRFTRGRALAEMDELLRSSSAVPQEPELESLPTRPLTIVLSCVEPSGEIHAVELARALRAEAAARGAPPPRLLGLGGAALAAEGVELWAEPLERAAMNPSSVVASYPYWIGVLGKCARRLHEERPDVAIFVDSPSLHVPLARIAKKAGVPTLHLVAPQFWAWAAWRVKAYRRVVDRPLTILPFEPEWFARRGVRVAHVGHPLLDARAPAGSRRARDEGSARPRTLLLLPGSRRSVVRLNLPWMLAMAAMLRIALAADELEVVIAHDREELEPELRAHVRAAGAESWVRVEPRGLERELARARLALSVSGTVLLELLRHDLPAVVVYRLERRLEDWLAQQLLATPWFSSVNLLAASEVYPEFSFAGDGPREAVLAALVRGWRDEVWRAACREGLARARERLGPPGAIRRAALHAFRLAASGGAE